MYESFYGLRERPFNLTPDPKYLYLSDKHKEAFAHLLYGIKNRSGFVMISGEIGTGKTTLCRNMLSQMDANTEVAFIFNPFLNPVELLKKINQEFGIISNADNVLALTEELNEHLLNAAAHGKNSVLVIDEAQNLEPQVLEQIRLLSNLETDSEKLLQIILIGQPELAEKLALHELRQLNQRITARYHLKPLNALETLQYIAYRIHVAGGRKKLNFTKGAIKAVYRKSGGVPRMINALCDRALLIGYTKEEHIITAAIVRQAAREIRGEKLAATSKRKVNWRSLLPSPSIAVVVLLVLAVAHFLMDPLDRFAEELKVFNRILTGDFSTPLPPTAPNETAAVSADSQAGKQPVVANSTPPEVPGALQLVMERLNTSTSKRQSDSLAAIFTDLNPVDTLHAGVDALVSLWNHNLAGVYPNGDSVDIISKYFEQNGLSAAFLRPTVDQLACINVPGLVRLVAGNNRVWMTLLRMDEANVILQGPENKRFTVSHQEFGIYYGREFLVPWRDPSPGAPILLPGQRGVSVRSLKEQLHTLGRLNANDLNDVYDAGLEKVILAIQQEAGLNIDGKAGPQVRLALASWTGNTPSLRRGNSAHTINSSTSAGQSVSSPETPPAAPAPENADEVNIPAPVSTEPVQDELSKEEPAAFQAVAERSAQMAVIPPEKPVMSLPEPPVFDKKNTPDRNDNTNYTDDLMGLRQRTENTAQGKTQGEYDAGLMKVRELPEPFAEPLQLPETLTSPSVTPPVFGSSPLVPHGAMQP